MFTQASTKETYFLLILFNRIQVNWYLWGRRNSIIPVTYCVGILNLSSIFSLSFELESSRTTYSLDSLIVKSSVLQSNEDLIHDLFCKSPSEMAEY